MNLPNSPSASTKAKNPHLWPAVIGQKKRIRQQSRPLLNKLETEWLEILKAEGTSWHISRQAVRFRLANGLWYKPDFFVWRPDKPLAFECKGPHSFRGGFENLKMAATAYHFIEWVLCWKDNGQWRTQTVLP